MLNKDSIKQSLFENKFIACIQAKIPQYKKALGNIRQFFNRKKRPMATQIAKKQKSSKK